jgi:hypothetical protein
MSAQWPANLLNDGDFTTAQPIGIPEFISPLPFSTTGYLFTQEFMQFQANYSPLPLNTSHPSSGKTPDYSTYFLVKESERRDMGGGLVKWKRTYATKPATHDEFESFAYNFIGFTGVFITSAVGTLSGGEGLPIAVVNPVIATGRPRKNRIVTSRVQHDYFLIGSSGSGLATPDYSTPAGIPQLFQQDYVAGGSATIGTWVDYLMDAVGIYPATIPSRSTYEGWMASAVSLGWGSGTVNPGTSNPGQILAEDSRISRWQGNIWVRQLRYVLAI